MVSRHQRTSPVAVTTPEIQRLHRPHERSRRREPSSPFQILEDECAQLKNGSAHSSQCETGYPRSSCSRRSRRQAWKRNVSASARQRTAGIAVSALIGETGNERSQSTRQVSCSDGGCLFNSSSTSRTSSTMGAESRPAPDKPMVGQHRSDGAQNPLPSAAGVSQFALVVPVAESGRMARRRRGRPSISRYHIGLHTTLLMRVMRIRSIRWWRRDDLVDGLAAQVLGPDAEGLAKGCRV